MRNRDEFKKKVQVFKYESQVPEKTENHEIQKSSPCQNKYIKIKFCVKSKDQKMQ